MPVAAAPVQEFGLTVLLPWVAELEVSLTEGADDAVFGRGTGIDRQRHTRTGGEVVAIAVAAGRGRPTKPADRRSPPLNVVSTRR